MPYVKYATVMAISLPLLLVQGHSGASELGLAQLITSRQKLMWELQDAYLSVLRLIQGESEDFGAAAALTALIPERLDGFSAMMRPDTAKGQAPGSRATPAVWEDPAAYAKAVSDLKERSKAIASAAAAGDREGIAAGFDAFTATCIACHGLRPSSGGPFRFAK